MFLIEKVFPSDSITESVEHISAEDLQSGTSIMSESPGTAMIYVYNDITDEDVILVNNLINKDVTQSS